MLAEDRLEKIVRLVEERGSVSASELVELLDASESTVRRDLMRLAEDGRLVKVHGGAMSKSRTIVAADQTVSEKHGVNLEAKLAIARRAAELIGPDDFVYIDAGSTTGRLVEAITETRATYMTNSLENASALVAKGCRVMLPGGELKPITEALVGGETARAIRRCHFTVGFFGANGATPDAGFTTPEATEALVKETALAQTLAPYVLVDSSKFSAVSPLTFADFDDATIITEAVPEKLEGFGNIIIAGR